MISELINSPREAPILEKTKTDSQNNSGCENNSAVLYYFWLNLPKYLAIDQELLKKKIQTNSIKEQQDRKNSIKEQQDRKDSIKEQKDREEYSYKNRHYRNKYIKLLSLFESSNGEISNPFFFINEILKDHEINIKTNLDCSGKGHLRRFVCQFVLVMFKELDYVDLLSNSINSCKEDQDMAKTIIKLVDCLWRKRTNPPNEETLGFIHDVIKFFEGLANELDKFVDLSIRVNTNTDTFENADEREEITKEYLKMIASGEKPQEVEINKCYQLLEYIVHKRKTKTTTDIDKIIDLLGSKLSKSDPDNNSSERSLDNINKTTLVIREDLFKSILEWMENLIKKSKEPMNRKILINVFSVEEGELADVLEEIINTIWIFIRGTDKYFNKIINKVGEVKIPKGSQGASLRIILEKIKLNQKIETNELFK